MSEPAPRPPGGNGRPKRRRRHRRPSLKPPAQPPGSPDYAGAFPDVATRIEAFRYDTQGLETLDTATAEECLRFHQPGRTHWLHVTGLRDTQQIARLGQRFGMHPLHIEDVLNARGRSKLDQDEASLFITLRLLWLDPQEGHVASQHLAFYAAPHLLLSFCETPTAVFTPVLQRLHDGAGRLRSMPVDYLLWALLDAVIDHYFIVIDTLDARLERLDESLEDGADQAEIHSLHAARRDVLSLSRNVRPVREIVSQLSHSDCRVLTPATSLFFRDLYDHAVHAIDQTDDLREQSNSIRDFFLASINNRMNEIMKVLACVSAIFLPLTFLAGIYGMNFEAMPELKWRYGYPAVWAVCLLLAAGMAWFFRRKKWL